ncbi:MAG TPA: hypothetical protein VNU70_05170 [Puia sp.]|nr:hypothetical protein [Puia sp.]
MFTLKTICRKLTRKLIVSALLITVVSLTFASKGGGGEKEKKASNNLKTNFTPVRTTAGFTLKAGPTFSGNYFLNAEKKADYVSFNTLVTYQKGNSTYIMPYHYKINTSMYLNNSGNNLRLLDLRINMSH